MTQLPRKIAKTTRLVAHLLKGLYLARSLGISSSNPTPSSELQSETLKWYQKLCEILNISITVQGTPPAATTKGTLVVANHISWLDIPVLGSVTPLTFLSKSEISRWPGIGKLATQAGTLFIQRGGKGAAEKAVENISTRISNGGSVLVFPEGTTTDGRNVRRFFARLLAAVENTDNAIQPIALIYRTENGEKNAIVPFVNNVPFASHFWALMGEKAISVELTFLPPVTIPPNTDKKHISQQLENDIREIVLGQQGP